MNTIAKRLTYYREKKGYSQIMLAGKAHVPQSAISEIESGKRKNPGYKLLVRLSKALEIPIGKLLDEKSA